MKAVADESFRDNQKWEKEIRAHFEWADSELSRIAGVGLRLVALYRQAPLRHERDADTSIRLAYLFLAAGLVDAAVDEFTTAMAIDPRDTVSIVREAVIPELESYLEKSATAAPSPRAASRGRPTPSPAPTLGGTLIQLKRFPDAERALTTALGADKSNADAHGDLALVFLFTGACPWRSPSSTARSSCVPTTCGSTSTWGWPIWPSRCRSRRQAPSGGPSSSTKLARPGLRGWPVGRDGAHTKPRAWWPGPGMSASQVTNVTLPSDGQLP